MKDEIQETLHLLVSIGICVIATSRPEGVDAEKWKESFVIANLKPLSDEQQRQMVASQLGKNVFFENLAEFTKIRTKHVEIFNTLAFPDADERKRIVNYSAPNYQFVNKRDGKRDGNMRQKTRDGKLCAVSTAEEPSSKYLLGLWAKITPEVVAKIDDLDALKDTEAPSGDGIEKLKQTIRDLLSVPKPANLEDPHDPPAVSVVYRLVLLVIKRRKQLSSTSSRPIRSAVSGFFGRVLAGREEIDHSEDSPPIQTGGGTLKYLKRWVPHTTAAALWPCIVARTDEIYATVEDLLPVFEAVMKQIVTDAGLNPETDLMLASGLKDPVRMHEKALDDYEADFPDWDDTKVVPETCVIDLLRGRAVAPSGTIMILLLDKMRNGFEVIFKGKVAKLYLLRCKNKMGNKDPTRFSNMLTNLVLEYDGVTVITELQVHHRMILEYNDSAHAHGPYEFFRSLFADTYETELDVTLEHVILFFEEVGKVPVLLSMLVLIFMGRKPDSKQPLPYNRFELYQQAIGASVAQLQGGKYDAKLVRQMVERVAIQNTMDNERNFRIDLVQRALAGAPAGVNVQLWNEIAESASGLPLVKTLELGTQFQFKHLSLQEALFAMAVVSGAIDESKWRVVDELKNKYCKPTLLA